MQESLGMPLLPASYIILACAPWPARHRRAAVGCRVLHTPENLDPWDTRNSVERHAYTVPPAPEARAAEELTAPLMKLYRPEQAGYSGKDNAPIAAFYSQ